MQENIAVIRKVFQAINQKDLDAIPPLLAPGFVRHDLTDLFDEIKGGEGVVQNFLEWLWDVSLAQIHQTIQGFSQEFIGHNHGRAILKHPMILLCLI